MQLITNTCFLLLYFCFAFFPFLQMSAEVPENGFLTDCKMTKISSDQLLISDESAHYIQQNGEMEPIDGIIYINGEMFAIQQLNFTEITCSTVCGHGYGCKKCYGCIKPGCWNYCPGCPK